MASRKLTVQILGDSKSLERAFASSERAAGKFGKGIKVAGLAAAAGVAAFGVAVVKGVQAASNLSEQINKSSVVFGKNAAEIRKWSETTADAFGLSQRAALEAAGGFGQMLQTAGVTEGAAAGMSQRLVELAADLASFNNIDPTVALEKLRSGLAGEAEPLRQVGVFLSEARVKAEAYASGIAKAGEELTEAQKVQARYNLIFQDTQKAQGDFARTSDSLANAQRRITAQFEEGAASLGSLFLPAVADAADAVATFLGDIRKARGIKAKFSVATEGLENLGRQIFDAARDSIERIDWAKLFDTVKAALNRFDQVLQDIDWDAVFARVREAISEAFRRITAFVDAIDFGEIGRRLGRALAATLETVARFLGAVNWNEVGRVIIQRLGIAIRNVVRLLKGLPWKAIAIGIVKLLAAAIRGVVALVVGIGQELAEALFRGISAGIDRASQFVLRKVLEFVNKVLGVTGFLGRFDPFKGVREKVQARLRQMEADAKGAADSINRSLAGIKDQTVDISISIRTAIIGPDGARRPEEGALGAERTARADEEAAAAVAAIGARYNAAARSYKRVAREAQAAAARAAKARTDAAAAAKRAAARLKAAREKQRTAFEALMESFDLNIDVAQFRGANKRALDFLKQQEKAIQNQIRIEGRTTELLRRLQEVREARQALEEDIAETARSAKQIREFRALGLTAEGEKPLPGLENLIKQFESLSRRLKGTPLEKKFKAMMARIGSVLKSGTKQLEAGTVQAILDMFAGIRAAFEEGGETFKKTATSALNAKNIVAGLGLDPREIDALTSRLSKFTTAGRTLSPKTRTTAITGVAVGGPAIQVNVPVYLDGALIARNTKRYLDNDAIHNPKQKRGPNAGRR